MPDRKLGNHVFNFNPNSNGSESLVLTTTAFANGDPGGVYLNQELTLQSYSNSASINLMGTLLTPEALRRLANELESFMNRAKLET